MERGLMGASNSLGKWYEEDKYEERIELFEDEIEEINQVIAEAVEEGTTIEIKHYISHLKKHTTLKCNVIKFYPERRCIRVREVFYLGVSEINLMDIAGAWVTHKEEASC